MGHATVTGTTVYMAPEVMGVEDEAFNDTGNSSDSKDSDSTNTELKRKSASQSKYKKGEQGTGADADIDDDHRPVGKGHAPRHPITNPKPLGRKDSILDEFTTEFEKENKNESELSTTYVVRKKMSVISSTQQTDMLQNKRHGYGRKADVWSLGVTLSEMSTGRSPYRTAAAAIYSVCVSKKYPTFPEEMSADAHNFLSR